MKNKKEREHMVQLLMLSAGLSELLLILKGICENIDLSRINMRVKQYSQFRFTFFGLIVKVNGILERMLFKCERFKNSTDGFNEIFKSISRVKKKMETAYECINNNKMNDSRKLIIESAEEYEKIYGSVCDYAMRRI